MYFTAFSASLALLTGSGYTDIRDVERMADREIREDATWLMMYT